MPTGATPASSPPTLRGVHHVAISVRDLDASVAFSARLLRAAPVAELGGERLRRRLVALPRGTNHGLTQHDRALEGGFSPFRAGLDHLGSASAPATTSSRGSRTSMPRASPTTASSTWRTAAP